MAINTINNPNTYVGDLNNLTTSNKSNIVGAVNELNSKLSESQYTLLGTAESMGSTETRQITLTNNITDYKKIAFIGYNVSTYNFIGTIASSLLATFTSSTQIVFAGHTVTIWVSNVNGNNITIKNNSTRSGANIYVYGYNF